MNWKTLNQNWKLTAVLVVTLVFLLAVLIGQSSAMSRVNIDVILHEFGVMSDVGSIEDSFTMFGAETVSEICNDGCILVVQNGDPQSFEGEEEVFINNGAFVIGE